MRHAHYGAAEGIFVTTSSFTAPARALAKQHGVTLMDGTTLTTYMQQLVHSKSPQ
ncbi:restriction endonuclease Mrr [Arthrobacter bambusae]|nr:restriction endonuclease Mrr [Arthrobacter bambusae]